MPERAGGVVAADGLHLHAVGVAEDRHADGLAVEQRHAHQHVGAGGVGHEGEAAVERARAHPRPALRRSAARRAAGRCAGSLLQLLVDVAGGTAGQIGGAALALGEGGQELGGVRGVVEDRGRGQVAEQRHAGEHAAALAEHEHRVEGVQAGAAGGLVDQEAGPAGLARGRPEVGQGRVAVERLARGLDRLEARQRAARGLAQEDLLV